MSLVNSSFFCDKTSQNPEREIHVFNGTTSKVMDISHSQIGKSIGLYGGSFDPLHYGHVQVVLAALEQRVVDHVWVVPTRHNPLKGPPEEGLHRLEMLKHAFAPYSQVSVCDIELQEKFAGYTIDVVRRLRQLTKTPLHLLLGSDCLETLPRWKEYATLLELAPPYWISRNQKDCKQSLMEKLNVPSHMREKLQNRWIDGPPLEISSTEIRRRLKEGLDCSNLVPKAVLDYIQIHGLYQQKDKRRTPVVSRL